MNQQLKLVVSAGHHTREHCPVFVSIPRKSFPFEGSTPYCMHDEAGNQIAVQCIEEDDSLTLGWVINRLAAGETSSYLLFIDDENRGNEAECGVRFVEKEHRLDVEIDGTFFTSYVMDPDIAKPYIGPVIGPYGESFTRLDFETKEHPHHRSMWLGIGDVNGIDIWNEPAGRHGKQRVSSVTKISEGPVLAQLTSDQVWTTFEGKAQVAEARTVTFYNTPSDCRIVDMEFNFTANKGQVEFGASKEAGPLGIRVAESMKAANGGTIINSYGSVGEQECWGKRAEWCDYYGNVGGHTLGIAAFDHPDNMDFPTYWHVRNYGLLAANNLYFLGGKLLKKGQSISYKHRICFHEGDAVKGKVADRYQDYIHPPTIEWELI